MKKSQIQNQTFENTSDKTDRLLKAGHTELMKAGLSSEQAIKRMARDTKRMGLSINTKRIRMALQK